MGPYREAVATETLEATTRDGLVRLEVGPRQVLLQVGQQVTLSVAEPYIRVTKDARKGRRKPLSIRLDSTRLVVARAVPSEEVGIWHEPEPGVATRLFGVRPVNLFDDQGLDALRALDRLVKRLVSALTPYSGGVGQSIEIGGGADRVLAMDFGDRLVIHVRPLFREHPRRVLEVRDSGEILFLSKGGEKRLQCTSRFGVTVIGDYVRFADPSGQDLGSLSIPWVGPEDRAHLVDLIGRRIHQG